MTDSSIPWWDNSVMPLVLHSYILWHEPTRRGIPGRRFMADKYPNGIPGWSKILYTRLSAAIRPEVRDALDHR